MSVEENKAIVRRYFKEVHDGCEYSIMEEITAPIC
jgi:hypothetical protein